MIVAGHVANVGFAVAETVLPTIDGVDLAATVDRVSGWGGDPGLYTRFLAAGLSVSAGTPDARSLGVIAGWRAGVLALRSAALSSAAAAQPAAVAAALAIAESQVAEFLAEQARDRFALPSSSGVVARVGGFRGFGGPWIAPPTSPRFVGDGVIEVDCGAEVWQIVADVFCARLEQVEHASASIVVGTATVETSADSYLVTISRQAAS
jgi:hypothetical protein